MLREYITVRAYYLSQEHPDDDADEHWVRAESEMIREAFVTGRWPARCRLDPHRADRTLAAAGQWDRETPFSRHRLPSRHR
jgi:hypothetical protein